MDRLFLLRPSFPDATTGPGAFHCTHCARLEGLLSYFPFLRASLDVRYLAYPRPRAEIVELVGEENQMCPLLVLETDSSHPVIRRAKTGRAFVAGPDGITAYLADQFGISSPHP